MDSSLVVDKSVPNKSFKRLCVMREENDNQTSNLSGIEPNKQFSSLFPAITSLTYNELNETQLDAIDKIFSNRTDDAPILTKWVLIYKPHLKVPYRKRLLIISSFRLWLLKYRKPFRDTLVSRAERQLSQIEKVKVGLLPSTSISKPLYSIQFFFRTNDKTTDLMQISGGMYAESIVRLVQRLLYGLRLVFPAKKAPHIELPDSCPWQEYPSAVWSCIKEESPEELKASMITAYAAFCDELQITARKSVIERLHSESFVKKSATCERLCFPCIDFRYCLSTLPSPGAQHEVEMISSASTHQSRYSPFAGLLSSFAFASQSNVESILAREVQALARTLTNCHGIELIHICDVPNLDEAAITAVFQSLLSPHSSLQGIVITNSNLTLKSLQILQQVVLQSTVKRLQNHAFRLKRLDLSFNHFFDQMAHELASIIELLPNGLEILQLEQCGISTACNSQLMISMKCNPSFSSCLKELNLSGNNLGLEGTQVLASWITSAFVLQQLDLSHTCLQMTCFFQALKQNTILYECSLRLLDLSYNQLTLQATVDLGYILETTRSLTTLFLRGMKRKHNIFRKTAARILFKRTRSSSMMFHMRSKTAGASTRSFLVKNSSKIGYYSTCGMRRQYLRNILSPMFQNGSRCNLCMVDLSENDLGGRKAELLAHLIDSSTCTARTSLRLDHTCLHDKASILLLHSLRSCKNLHSISLQGNGYVKRHNKRARHQFIKQSGLASSEFENSVYVASQKFVPPPLEQAAANAFSLLLGGQEVHSGTSSGYKFNQNLNKKITYSFIRRNKRYAKVKELCMKCEGPYVYGSYILTSTIQSLSHNNYLHILDVSGNDCGDILPKTLGEVLPLNKTLEVLFWDENYMTVNGFECFHKGLLHNTVLKTIQMPICDIRRILEEQKNPPRDKLFSILGKIFHLTERNQNMSIHLHRRLEVEGSNLATYNVIKNSRNTSDNEQPELNLNQIETDGIALKLEKKSDLSVDVEYTTAYSIKQTHSPKFCEKQFSNYHNRSLSSSTNLRYPSTMMSWSSDLPETSWNISVKDPNIE